jgi:hypothetical protein
MSILSAVNDVNLVNTVNDVKIAAAVRRRSTREFMELRFTLIPDSDFGEITDTAFADGGRDGFWTALTLLTALTADVVDEVDLVGFCRQRCPSPLSITSTMSILSAVNDVNLVNTVNDVKIAAAVRRRSTKEFMELRFTMIPDSDFGEITDTASAKGGPC